MAVEFLHQADPVLLFSVFGLVLSVWLIAIMAFSIRRAMRVQRVERRLGMDEQEGPSRVVRLWHEGRETTTTVPLNRSGNILWRRLSQHLRDVGWAADPRVVALGLLVATGAVFGSVWVALGSWIPAAVIGSTVVLAFFTYTNYLVEKRTATFEKQFADALSMVGRSLRAGQPLLSGIQLASQQLPAPVCDVFAEVCQQHAFGVPLDDALRSVGTKYASRDLRLFTTAVVIQLHTGGNLADLMDRLAHVIRERMRLSRRVRVLTAQTRFSTRILTALPFIVFFLVNLLNPGYMKPLFTTSAGQMMLLVAGTSLLFGTLLMKSLSRLRP